MYMKKDFTQIPNNVTKNEKLSDGAYRTYVLLLSYKFSATTRVYPSHKTLSKLRGTDPRTIGNHLNELRTNRLVSWKRRGFSSTNEYVFIMEDKFRNDGINKESKLPYVSKKSTYMLRKDFLGNNIDVNNTKDKNIDSVSKIIETTRKKYEFLRTK